MLFLSLTLFRLIRSKHLSYTSLWLRGQISAQIATITKYIIHIKGFRCQVEFAFSRNYFKKEENYGRSGIALFGIFTLKY